MIRGSRHPRGSDGPTTSRDSGAASVLAIALCGALTIACGAVLPLAMSLGASQRADGAADSGALAAADVASGLSPGEPCAIAALVVSANNARMTSCDVDGMVVTIQVGVIVGVVALSARATAGPPGSRSE